MKRSPCEIRPEALAQGGGHPYFTGREATFSDQLFKRIFFEAGQLAYNAQDKEWIVLEITPPQPARLAIKPEQPFQTAALHPAGRLTNEAGMKIKSRPHSKHEGGVKFLPILRHEFFLLRRAQANPDDVRFLVIHHPNQLLFLSRIQRSEGRRVRADNFDAGKFCLQSVFQFLRHAVAATVEKVGESSCLSEFTNQDRKSVV